MTLRRDAMMRLSVLTTEIGRKLAGVYAGPRCWEVLEGFLGRRWRMAWLKSLGYNETSVNFLVGHNVDGGQAEDVGE